jgi:hypothetical protein
MNTKSTPEFRCCKVRDKDIYFVKSADNSWLALCECMATGATIKIRMTAEKMSEVLSPARRKVQNVLPAHPKQLCEIFISGLTPAEFDLSVRGKVRSPEFYEKLGYEFSPFKKCLDELLVP